MQKIILIVIIVVFASILRLTNLSLIPPKFSEDEAAISYNAYSVLKTAKDEDSRLMPVEFISFGDYKSPLSIYVTVPFIGLGGLNIDSSRLPAALFGIFSVMLFYILGVKIFDEKTGLLTAVLATFSPWHIQLSRFSTPVSIAIFLILLELIIFYSSFKKKFLCLSVIQILLILTYPGSLVVSVPLFLYYLFFSSETKFSLITKGIICLILVVVILIQKNSISHFYFESTFYKDLSFQNRINELRGYSDSYFPHLVGLIFQNKIVYFFDQLSKNYLKSFDFYYLFSYAWGKDKNLVDVMGKLYSIELIFFLIGLFYTIKKNVGRKVLLIIIFLVSPFVSILKLNVDIGTSLFFITIPFYLFAASGFIVTLGFLSSFKTKIVFVVSILAIYTLSLIVFLHYYFLHFPKNGKNLNNSIFENTSKRAFKDIEKYEKIVVSDKYSRTPYIYYLFYNGVDPKKYQESFKQRSGSEFISTTKLGNIEFRSIDYIKDDSLMNVAFIGSESDIGKFGGSCAAKNSCFLYKNQIKVEESEETFYLLVNKK